jgi:hypothetical protein
MNPRGPLVSQAFRALRGPRLSLGDTVAALPEPVNAGLPPRPPPRILTPMLPLRRLLVSLIVVSLVALVLMPALIWVSRPERTASALLFAFNDGDIDAFNSLVVDLDFVLDPHGPTYVDEQTINIGHARLVPVARKFHDYLAGVQRLRLLYPSRDDEVGVTFIAGPESVSTDAHVLMKRIDDLKARLSRYSAPGSQ